mmetsp:Transcript_22910/g.63758  ORF Transcript_22910/g.63758 Transcript_22910/m.63758 type:complete len:224 (+) Transcript_22910:339-1010(+)
MDTEALTDPGAPVTAISGSTLFNRCMTRSISLANLGMSTVASAAPMLHRARAIPWESPTASAADSSLTDRKTFSLMRPTIPKSIKPTRPSSSNIKFPACTSAWKNGMVVTDLLQMLSAVMMVCMPISGSWDTCEIVDSSNKLTPFKNSSVMTFFVVYSKYTLGAVAAPINPSSNRKRRNSMVFLASLLKSSSSSMEARRSPVTPESEVRSHSGWMNSRMRAAE